MTAFSLHKDVTGYQEYTESLPCTYHTSRELWNILKENTTPRI